MLLRGGGLLGLTAHAATQSASTDLSLTIDSIIALSVANCNTTTDPDSSRLTIKLSPLASTDTYGANCQTLSITTNTPGYSLTTKAVSNDNTNNLTYQNPTTVSPLPFIPALPITNTPTPNTGTPANPTTLTSNSWGFAVENKLGFDTSYSTNPSLIPTNKFANLPTTDITIADTNIMPSSTEDYIFYYATRVPSSKLAGIYSAVITYTAVGKLVPGVTDTSGANAPNLHANMIPVKWDGATWVKADVNNMAGPYQWYDYGSKMWANAVTVKETGGTRTRAEYKSDPNGQVIDMDDILTFMVWIPRYRYQLWNANNGSSNEQQINIVFERKSTSPVCGGNPCTSDRDYLTGTDGGWLTHPAFTFGSEELSGFWVGKFELTGSMTACAVESCATAQTLTIKPNLENVNTQTTSSLFYGMRSMSNRSDNPYGYTTDISTTDGAVNTHMIKNTEWGAIAYLSHSKYGTCTNNLCAEIYVNPSTSYVTGRSGSVAGQTNTADVSGVASVDLYGYDGAECSSKMLFMCTGTKHVSRGMSASTTGNIYGVYDMAGGGNENVMGNMVDSAGDFFPSLSGFTTPPTTKYYNSYAHDASSNLTHDRGKLGDAAKETLKTFGNVRGSWYGNYANFVNSTNSWVVRGGSATATVPPGLFYFTATPSGSNVNNTSRVVHK